MEAIARALRRVVGQATLLGYSAARALGVSQVDLETLEILRREGPQPTGRLAEATGLTTSAATRQIDRLEASGYVRRIGDPADRRRAIVTLIPERAGTGDPLVAGIADGLAEALADYDDRQLTFAADVLDREARLLERQAERWRAGPPAAAEAASASGESSAPLGGATHGRLVFVNGSPPLTLTAGDRSDLLYEARFSGGTPRVRVRVRLARAVLFEAGHGTGLPRVDVRSGTVTFRFPGLPFLRQGGRGTVRLNPTIPWAIVINGGLSQLDADLRRVRVERIQIAGGANRGRVELGPAVGAVGVTIAGGANDLTIRRPAGVGVEITAAGGISKLVLDGRQISGASRVTAPGANPADRYEMTVAGGANRLVVETRD
jgi:DNA-binding MarR family transcriptional regulator